MKMRLLLNNLALVVLGLAAAYVTGVYVLGFHPRLVISMFVLITLLYLPHIVSIVRHRLRPSGDEETEEQGVDPKKTMRDDFALAAICLVIAFLVSIIFLRLDAMMTSVVICLVAVRYTPHLVKSYRAGRGVERR